MREEQPGHNTQPHAQMQPSFQGIDAWITSKLIEAWVCKLPLSLMCLADIFDMSPMVVGTTRHWQISGRLGQELNVCTVYVHSLITRRTEVENINGIHMHSYNCKHINTIECRIIIYVYSYLS